jgi:hypothetical protein
MLALRFQCDTGGLFCAGRARWVPRHFEAFGGISLPVRIQAPEHSVPACLSTETERPARLNI